MRNSDSSEWSVWQLADSAFPAGGFGHSGGLEASWQGGAVRADADLSGFLRVSLSQVGHSQVPFVAAVHRSRQLFSEIDQHCDVFLSNHVANRASRAQGRALLSSAESIYDHSALRDLRAESRRLSLACHLPTVFGFLTAVLGIDASPACRLYLFVALRGIVSSAIRLGLVGPLKAQAMQHAICPFAEKVARRSEGLSLDDAAQTAPVIELFQANQDNLYSRLFQS